MMQSLLLIVRSGVEAQLIVAEAIDAALVCSAFGMEVSLLLEGDGLDYLEEVRLNQLLEHAAPEDFARIMAHSSTSDERLRQSSADRGLEYLSSSQALESLQAHHEVLVI